MAKPRRQPEKTHQAPLERPNGRRDRTEPDDLDFLKSLWNFGAQFRERSEPDKVFRAALRLGFDKFDADEGCLVSIPPGRDEPEILFREPRDSIWAGELLTGFLRGQRMNVPSDTMFARIRRHERMWGALVVRRRGADFRWDSRQGFSSIGVVASQLINDMDAVRLREVRNRIDRKLLDQIGPKNLFYEILHSLRSLTGYDHSAALLIFEEAESRLEIVAEQISWRKAKGQLVGSKLTLSAELQALLSGGEILGFNRDEKGWRSWLGKGSGPLAQLLDFHDNRAGEGGLIPENSILCAPLTTRDGLLGMLKVAAVRAGTFGQYEAGLIGQFLPQAALALQGWRRLQSLERQVLAAERKHAMADLARGVAHDINNALGVLLPLVQQLQADCEQDDFDARIAAADLRDMEKSLQLCRRVFGGMLKFGRGIALNASEVYFHDAVESSLAIIRSSLERRGISIRVDVPTSLPSIKGVQADVEQLLLNLMSNAADAMDGKGELTIRAWQSARSLQLSVEDTGSGIRPEDLPKIQEPFFTTKTTGNGLGLAICRSIAAHLGGRLQFESQLGKGTRVTLLLPLAGEGP